MATVIPGLNLPAAAFQAPASGGPITPIPIPGFEPPPIQHALFGIPHLFEKTGENLIDAFRGSAGALVHGGLYALTHDPVTTAEQLPGIAQAQLHQIAQDFAHPLRNPGYTLMDLASLIPVPGAIVAGRFARAAATLGRAGEVSSDLAKVIRPGIITQDYDAARALAGKVGKQSEFTRAYTRGPQGEPILRDAGEQARKTILHGVPREQRLLRSPDGELVPGWMYSRDPTIRMAQKLVDRAYDTRGWEGGKPPVYWRVVPGFWRTQSGRISRAATARNIGAEGVMGADAQTFFKKFGDSTDAEHLVARMVRLGVTTDAIRDYYGAIVRGEYLPTDKKGRPFNRERQLQESQRMLDLADEVDNGNYVRNVTHAIISDEGPTKGRAYSITVPVLQDAMKGSKIDQYINDLGNLSKERENAFTHAGVLSESSRVGRIMGALHEMNFRRLPDYEEQQSRMERQLAGIRNIHGEEAWQAMADRLKMAREDPPIPFDVAQKLIDRADLTYVPDDIPMGQRLKSFITTDPFRRGMRGTSRPAPPSTITHPFQASVMRAGGGDINTARVMAKSYTEAMRYIALHNNWLRIANNLSKYSAHIPEKNRRLVRDPKIKDAMTRTEAERFVKRAEAGGSLGKEEAEAYGMNYEAIRSGLFPKSIYDAASNTWHSLKDLAAGDGTTEAPHGYGWADSRLLGGLDKQNPLISILHDYPLARTAVRSLDAINAINKTALLYLKPAYLFPNLMSNIALNLIQQGFMAPVNLGKALALWNGAEPEIRQGILSAMHEGGSRAISEQPGDIFSGLQSASRKAGEFWGKIVDEPTRIASFYHEAAVDGFSSKAEIRDLVTKPEYRDQLVDISQRANDAIINYSLMSPAEQAIMRRVIFFYPWIKGATRYTANLYKEHPLQFGEQQMLGHQESERSHGILGDVPSWARGLEAVGRPNKKGLVDVRNPMAFSILGTPAQLLEEALNVVNRNPDKALSVIGEMAPSERFGLDLLSAGATASKSSASGSGTASPLQTGLYDYYGGNPVKLLVDRLRNTATYKSVYPNQPWLRDLSQFALFGGMTNRQFDVNKARYYEYLHKSNPKMFG